MSASTLALVVLFGCSPTPAGAPAAPDLPAPTQAAPLVPQRALLSHEILLTGGATEDQPLPLLVAVHGMGSRPEQFAGALVDLDVPARVILPLAPHPTASGGGSWFAFRLGDPDRDAFGLRVHEASEDLVALMDWAEDRYPTKGRPVITGFSQGGMLSFAVAAGWPDEIAAALPVGGDMALSLVPSDAPPNPPPVIAFHGTVDDVVPIGPVERAVEALRAVGYDVALHRYEGVGHGISAPMRQAWHAALASELEREAGQARPAAACPPIDGQGAALPSEQRIRLGQRALVVETCRQGDAATAVRARLEGGTWAWAGDYVYDAPASENELLRYTFEAGGALRGGGQALVLRYVACDYDGCDRVRFYRVDPAGRVSLIADETQATSWGTGPGGAFSYTERTGYSLGYHVASAAWTYRWDGEAFQRQPKAVLKAEYERWPCPDGEVQPVEPSTGQPVGEPIPVPRGAPIEVLDVDPDQPGVLFEYRLGDQRFWAKDWTQTCAG
jgi:phospholipase/carboxylesterase